MKCIRLNVFAQSAPWFCAAKAFSSVVRQVPGYTSQRRGTARTLPSLIVLFHVLIVLFYVLFCADCVVHVLIVCKCILLPPGVNPIAVKYIISYIISYRCV